MMGSKILAFGAMAMGLAASILLAIATFAFPHGQTVFFWLASCAIFLMSLRFNIVALRNDAADRMLLPNAGLVFVAMYLIFIFICHLVEMEPFVTYIVIGALLICFAAIFAAYWIRRRRGY